MNRRTFGDNNIRRKYKIRVDMLSKVQKIAIHSIVKIEQLRKIRKVSFNRIIILYSVNFSYKSIRITSHKMILDPDFLRHLLISFKNNGIS